MALTPGTRLGVYNVTALLGAGGMGQVFRARDTTLNRDVALKVLPDSFATDADRLARFTREAQTLASLNHSNIAAIHSFEHFGGTHVLVMELVEGDDLSQRLAHGAIAPEEALAIAKQIADALEAAHEQGIIHRDLKPANIKVRADGMVKVLDFGLAKAMDAGNVPPAGDAAASMIETVASPVLITGAGVILGTAAYMSPEQTRGRSADRRADIWAFGVVLYEMLTGQRLFEAADATDTAVAVLSRELHLTAFPPATPARVRALVHDCLVRDPRQRLRDIGEARRVLEGTIAGVPDPHSTPATAVTPRIQRRPVLPWTVAAVSSAALAATVFAWAPWGAVLVPAEVRTEITVAPTTEPGAFALSPDGRQVAFVASSDGVSRLWIRSLATAVTQPIAGTDGARYPFWSPDSRSIGFFAEGSLKRFDLRGGAPRVLAPAANGSGGTWNPEGVVVFAPSFTSPLMRVSAEGGVAAELTALEDSSSGHRFPQFLPDGRRFVFSSRKGTTSLDIFIGSLDGTATRRLATADSAVTYLAGDTAGGWLLWVRGRTLVAQRLDAAMEALRGEPIAIADGVHLAIDGSNRGAFSVSPTGLIAYRLGEGNKRQLTWVDRSGATTGTLGEPNGAYAELGLSPDGRRVAVAWNNSDVWLMDGVRSTRFTFDSAVERYPVWSPDGTRIAFRSGRTARGAIYQKETGGGGTEELLLESDQLLTPTSWSADGRFLLYMSNDPQTAADLWVMPMTGARTPSVVLKTAFREAYAVLSPDSRWIAYQSNESGRVEVYVRLFVPPGTPSDAVDASGVWQVSTAGGIYPVWRPDGKELYFLSPAGAMMAASITVNGSTLQPAAPVTLFRTSIVGGGSDSQQGRHYDAGSNGRFLINVDLLDSATPITLVQHWNPSSSN